ncbi:MAG: nitric-oxide reductase large subunit [Gammaproteobacteria bacterium]|nr:nitric-oxide reductase large subunit [Gammaproteobacteria bacterium]
MNYREIFTFSRLWTMFGVSLVLMFGILLLVGGRAFQLAPPMPDAVVATDGDTTDVIFTSDDIRVGRDVWRRLGGMELGSVWGHGSYLAPDWTADVLHREAMAMLDADGDFATLSEPARAARIAEFAARLRINTYDTETGQISISQERAQAIAAIITHYQALFGGSGDGPEAEAMREAFAIPNAPLGPDPDEDIRALVSWWWWTSWAAATLRPDDTVTYTNNWPHEPLVGNKPTSSIFIWTFVSIVLLIAGIGALCWFFLREREEWQKDTEPPPGYPDKSPIATVEPTASMRGVVKYIWIVAVLLGLQILLGAVTAHYAVEGHEFYGIPLAEIAPYALTRTWHVQLAVLWIATAWLGAGLYLAPMIAGSEPPLQKLGVDVLWVALVIAVLGSLAGEWLALTGRMTDPAMVYWFGHQGYEFLDMGRFWQILIFAGLLIWLGLMARCLVPAIRAGGADKHLLILLLISSAGIGLLFGAGFLYERDTHLTIAEYWRWWVVHLWVEGVFEVFATAWVAWVFVHMKLLRPSTAAVYVMFSAMIFLGGGVLGTFHHLYFAGTPEAVLALGAVFSALEVVPLALIGFEAHDHWRAERQAPWVSRYHLPLMFFLAVAFWNLVGAGVLGFLINPPLALYYMQGLLTTPTHGHAALFGVYGMLGIGLLLLCRRDLPQAQGAWNDKTLKWVFWLFNGGLALMVFGSLLPQGIIQTLVSFDQGYWYARSPELLHSPLMETLVWLRVPGDVVFAAGAVLLLVFLVRLELGRRS